MGSFRATIAEDGGVTIPAAYREALSLVTGTEVILTLEDHQIRLYTVDAAIRRAQDLVGQYVDSERSSVAELLAERRVEAENEWYVEYAL